MRNSSRFTHLAIAAILMFGGFDRVLAATAREKSCIVSSFLQYDRPGVTLNTAQTLSWLRQRNLYYCPPDYKEMYLRHMAAWEDYAKIESAARAMEDRSGVALASSILATLTNSRATPFTDYIVGLSELKRVRELNRQNINDTFAGLQKLAREHGVKPPTF